MLRLQGGLVLGSQRMLEFQGGFSVRVTERFSIRVTERAGSHGGDLSGDLAA